DSCWSAGIVCDTTSRRVDNECTLSPKLADDLIHSARHLADPAFCGDTVHPVPHVAYDDRSSRRVPVEVKDLAGCISWYVVPGTNSERTRHPRARIKIVFSLTQCILRNFEITNCHMQHLPPHMTRFAP